MKAFRDRPKFRTTKFPNMNTFNDLIYFFKSPFQKLIHEANAERKLKEEQQKQVKEIAKEKIKEEINLIQKI